jgi:hypothetical protein
MEVGIVAGKHSSEVTPEETSQEDPPKGKASESLTRYVIKLSLAAALEAVKYWLRK